MESKRMKLGDCSQSQNNQNQNQQTETSQETSESIISWQIELLKAQDDNYINRLLESCRTFSTSTDDVEHEAINFAIETYGLGLSATQDDLPSPDDDISIPQLDQPSTSQSSSQSQKTFLNDTHNVETEAVDYAIRRYGLQRNDLS
ncbi:unnamed protein product [Diamesa hyperborea]